MEGLGVWWAAADLLYLRHVSGEKKENCPLFLIKGQVQMSLEGFDYGVLAS